MTRADIDSIEHHALAGWPAEVVEELDGWRLRAMSGVTRRANSVWTAASGGRVGLDERIARAEAFYAARGLPPMFQVGDASEPIELDEVLARRGYLLDAPVLVQTAEIASVKAGSPSAESVVVEPEPSAAWLEVSARQGRYRGVEPTYIGLLERLGGRARFALATVAGEPAAVGLGVLGERWMSVCSMLTLPPFRRHGLGRQVLSALTRSGAEAGATSLYLQVEVENAPARSLYESLGFRRLYAYHYRICPA